MIPQLKAYFEYTCSRALRTPTIKNLALGFNAKILRTRALVLTTSSYSILQ